MVSNILEKVILTSVFVYTHFKMVSVCPLSDSTQATGFKCIMRQILIVIFMP